MAANVPWSIPFSKEYKEKIKKSPLEKQTIILCRLSFKINLAFEAGLELVRRGKFKIMDRNKHWTWEWIAIQEI